MAFDQEEIVILRTELFNLLSCLDNIADSENRTTTDIELVKNLEEKNRNLELQLSLIQSETRTAIDTELVDNLEEKNRNLEHQLSQIKSDSERFAIELSQIKCEHEKCEYLERELSQLKSDQVLLVQSLESVRSEKENLLDANQKLALDNEALKVRLEEIQEVSYRQSDKIIALRSVAKALESENELISRDNGRHQIKGRDEKNGTQDNNFLLRFRLGELESELNAKEEERKGFMQCFEKLESEKLNLGKKLSEIETNFETVRKERDDLKTSLGLSNDTLDALRQSKRLVENKYQNVVEMSEKQSREIESQNREIESMLIEKLSLVEQLSHRNANLEAMQQELELQATMYESTISQMQSELDKRLDEVTASKDEDAEVIRERFVELFDEKAQELNRVETEYADCKLKLEVASRKLVDSEYKEQELKEHLQRKNSYAESNRQVHEEVENLTKLSSDLEDQLNRLKLKYESLKTSYLNLVAHFRSAESQKSLPATPPPHQQTEQEQQQLWNRDININRNSSNNNNNNPTSEKLSASKKKRKNAKKNKK